MSFSMPMRVELKDVAKIIQDWERFESEVQGSVWTIDCANVVQFDSAFVALLLYFLQRSLQLDVKIHFCHVPSAWSLGVTEAVHARLISLMVV